MDLAKIKLTRYILIGLGLGLLCGLLLGQFVEFKLDDNGEILRDSKNRAVLANGFIEDVLLGGVLEFMGQAFIRALKMLVVPLVFVSLVCGAAALDDIRKLGSIGLKTLGLYLGTTCIAISIAIVAALIFKPGVGVEIGGLAEYTPMPSKPLIQVFIDIIPNNVFGAFVNGEMLQIIVVALALGIALVLAGDHGKRVLGFFQDLNEVIMKLVVLIMLLAPFGVFAKMTQVFATEGMDTIWALFKYFVLVVVVLLIHGFVVYPSLLGILGRMNPGKFFAKIRNVQLFAFSTASSNATIPITLRALEEKVGVSNKVASFTVPLGATINMDGTAIMQGVATVFIAQYAGIDLSITDYLMVIVTATLASIGTAGVPSAGLVMLTMVLAQVGLPAEHIGLIIGIDRILDMVRTAVNVTGDAAVTCIVARSEGQVDQEVFDRSV